MYSLPTSWEVIFTKMLAITHLLLGFEFRKPNRMSIVFGYADDDSFSVNSLVGTGTIFLANYSLFEIFKSKSNPNYSGSPSSLFKKFMRGSTQLSNFSAHASELLKWIKVERQIFCSCGFSRLITICSKRFVFKNKSFDDQFLVYCKMALSVPYFTSTLGSDINPTNSSESS